MQLSHSTTHDLKDVVKDLIACPVLTSFTVTSHGWLGESTDFAIWSREHGFPVDNTDEEKAKQLLEAALEVQETCLEEECQSGQIEVAKWTHFCDLVGHWTTSSLIRGEVRRD